MQNRFVAFNLVSMHSVSSVVLLQLYKLSRFSFASLLYLPSASYNHSELEIKTFRTRKPVEFYVLEKIQRKEDEFNSKLNF